MTIDALWELAKSAGAFAVPLMLFLYLRVDAERRSMTRELLDLSKATGDVTAQWMRILEKSQITRQQHKHNEN